MTSGSPMAGLAGYSPFMMAPMVPGYSSLGSSGASSRQAAEAVVEPRGGSGTMGSGVGRPTSPVHLPGSPLTPGVMLSASPFSSSHGGANSGGSGGAGSSGAVGMPSPSPEASFFGGTGTLGSLSPQGAGAAATNATAAALSAAAPSAYTSPSMLGHAASDASMHLPPFYYAAAAAAAAAGGGTGSLSSSMPTSLGSALSHHAAAAAAAASHQHSLSGAFSGALGGMQPSYLQGYPSAALEAAALRDATFALHLEQRAALEQQLSAAASAGLLGQHLSTPLGAAVAAQANLLHAQQQHQVHQHIQAQHQAAAAAAALSAAAASAAGGMPLAAQMGRLRVTHSADLSSLTSHMDHMQLLQQARPSAPRFKTRKNAEPKIGPDGQPRLNARQRRTLRRARERALKGLLEISQALLRKADVDVQVPNLKDLAALEELAEQEAERAEAAAERAAAGGSDVGGGQDAGHRGGGGGGGSGLCGLGDLDYSGGGGGEQRSGATAAQLAEAAAVAGESVERIALAAVAAVAAAAAGRDTTRAAAAAQAAAATATSAAMVGRSAVHAQLSVQVDGANSKDQDPDSEAGTPTTSGAAAARPPPRPLQGSASAADKRPAAPGARAAPPSPGGAVDLESGLDIGGLINQLSQKKDEGMVDDKLLRDLQIIQSLIGALKAPALSPQPGGGGGGSGAPPAGGAGGRNVRRSFSYSPGMGAQLQPSFSLPH